MSAPLLEIENLSAGYGGNVVLRELSLALPEGAVYTVIGPNGHGKTTLLRTISGLIKPMQGEIRLAGKSVRGLAVEAVVAEGVVHIPQGDLIFPDMTVYDNLLMGAYLPSAYAKVAERLAKVFALLPKLQERQGQIASTLSGGERRMLGIGRGLMTGGRLLMIDEPSLGLAPILIDQIYAVIRGLKEEGRTILLVEENASRVMTLSERVFLLDNGAFVWSGAPGELASQDTLIETYLGG
jgi:branched-chain amino acid transport system ATP-binding protein